MVSRSSLLRVTAIAIAGLALGLTMASTSALAQNQDVPPVLPSDLRADPALENVTDGTDQVTFTIELATMQETYTGDYQVELSIGEQHVATIEDVWPPDRNRINVTTDEDAGEGQGYWEPSIGEHPFNLTVSASGSSFPLDFTLPMGPDPAVQATDAAFDEDPESPIQTEPAQPTDGDEVDVLVNVTNQGTWATPEDEPLDVHLRLDGETLATRTIVDPIESFNDTQIRFEDAWTAETGTQELSVEAEVGFTEVNETNNEHTTQLTVRETGLDVGSLDVQPRPVPAGEPATVTASVTNAGEEPVEETVTALYVDEDPVAEAQTPALDPAESANVTWEIELAAGAHELLAAPNAEEPTSPPPRDPATTSVNVIAGPNLVVEVAHVDPNPAVEGDNVTVSASVENQGTTIEDPITVALQDAPQDGKTIATHQLDGLAHGNATPVEFTFHPTAGEHDLVVVADPGENVTDAHREDNRDLAPLHVREHVPDLAISGFGLAQENPFPGQSTPAEARLVNQDEETVDNLTARFRLDGRQLGQTIEIDPLEPGETATLTSRDWQVQAGDHQLSLHVGTRADLQRGHPLEEASTTLSIEDAHPDVVVEDARVEPSDPQPGEEVRLIVDVVNQGPAPAQGLTVAFETDGERIGIDTVDELAPEANATLASPTWEADAEASQAEVIVDPEGEVHPHDAGRNRTFTVDASQAETPAPSLLGALAAALGASAVARRRP